MAKQREHAYPRTPTINRVHIPGPPAFHEKGYLVSIDGDCLEPVVHHGEIVAVEPTLPKAGELACFFKGKENGSVKLLVNTIRGFPVHPDSAVVQLILAQQFNPPQCYRCLADQLDAIHRVVWVRRNDKWVTAESLLSEIKPVIPVLTLREIAQAY
jgi:hypothetical protein